jgi:esterase/lipase superfamily enzyme/uncharacterized small protein (DUF1192 family)
MSSTVAAARPAWVRAAICGLVLALLPAVAEAERAGVHCAGLMPADQASERLVDLEAMLKKKVEALRIARTGVISPETEAAIAKLQAEIERLQAEMAEMVYATDCKPALEKSPGTPRGARRGIEMPKPAEAPAPSPPVGAAAAENVEMDVFFATSRAVDPAGQGADRFKAAHGGKLQYGRAVVSIPKSHKEGNLELPAVWRFELVADPNKHFVLKSAALLDTEPLRAEIRASLARAERKAVLVFVHGYNSSFTDAAFRSAQLAQDLKFKGLPMFFSWPSAGKISGYAQDAESERLSEPLFETFLEELYADGFEDIYVVAHSMGSRIASTGLSSRIAKGGDVTRIRALMLAAPDLNETLFREQIAPQFAKLSPQRATIYASSSDIALKASRYVNGYRRIGETDGGVGSYEGAEVVDSTGVCTIARGFGHSYVVDSREVLSDIQRIIELGKPAAARGLVKKGTDPAVHWAFK